MSLRNLKNKYDRKVLETFDLIGCYFIDLFYNDLFLKAKHAFTTGHSKSLTETYRSHIIWFMRGIDEKPKNYIEVMKKLLDYYNAATKTITSTLSELEHKILCQFIPTEYYQDFTNANKEKVLHDIIIRAVNQLGELALEPVMLGKIIDDHLNQGNIQLLQEKMTDILIMLREEYYSKFVNEISKAGGNKTVSIEQFKKLKGEYAEEIKRRIAIESERDRAVQLLQVSLQKLSELESKLAGYSAESINMDINPVSRVNTPVKIVNSPVRIKTPVQIVKSPVQAVKAPVQSVKNGRISSPQVDNIATVTTATNTKGKKQSVLQSKATESTGDMVSNQKGTGVGLKRSELNSKNRVELQPSDNSDDDGNEDRDSGNDGGNPHDSEKSSHDSSEGSDTEDSAELHRRQKKALIDKRQSELTLGLEDDDPGFGH